MIIAMVYAFNNCYLSLVDLSKDKYHGLTIDEKNKTWKIDDEERIYKYGQERYAHNKFGVLTVVDTEDFSNLCSMLSISTRASYTKTDFYDDL